MYQIKEAAEMSGVSVRALHYYDQIGLLSPRKSENGYRFYSDEDMDLLQEILFYRFLGFPLKELRDLLSRSDRERQTALTKQYELLKAEESRIHQLVETLEKTIQQAKGEIKMTVKEKFQGFRMEDNKAYREESIQKYGEDVILESERRQAGKEAEMTDRMNQIFFSFASNREKGMLSTDDENIALAGRLHETLCTYSFDCSMEVFGYIGKGYTADLRFKSNIDQFGNGTAQYVSEAIAAYVQR